MNNPKELINKLSLCRESLTVLLNYITENSLSDPIDFENQIKENPDKFSENLVFEFINYNNLKGEIEQFKETCIFIEQNKNWTDYNLTEEDLRQSMILFEENCIDLKENLEKKLNSDIVPRLNDKIEINRENQISLDLNTFNNRESDNPRNLKNLTNYIDPYNNSNKICLILSKDDQINTSFTLENINLTTPPRSDVKNYERRSDSISSFDFNVLKSCSSMNSEFNESFKFDLNIENEDDIKDIPESFIKYMNILEIIFNLYISFPKDIYKNNQNLMNVFNEKFSKIWKDIELYYSKNNISNFKGVEILKRTLKYDLFEDKNIINALETLIKIKNIVIPLDIRKLKSNFEKTIQAAEKVKDQDVVVLMGNSNAGKSTITNFLGGSKMKETMINGNIRHIFPDKIIYQELKNIAVSHKALSESRYVVAFQVNNKDLEIDEEVSLFIADLPGLFENRDVETEISNNIGVTRFLKSCKRLRILFILNYCDMVANNLQGVRDLVYVILSLVGSVSEYINYFLFAINKTDQNGYNELIQRIENLENELSEKEKNDKIFKDSLLQIKKRMKKECFLINPMGNKNELEETYGRIIKCHALENPGYVFKLTLSPKANIVLEDFLKSKEKFIDNAIENSDLQLLRYQIEELSFFNHFEEMENFNNKIPELYSKIKEKLNKNYESIKSIIEEVNANNYAILIQSQIEKLEQSFIKIQNLDEIRKFCPNNEEIFTYDDSKNLMNGFLSDLAKFEKPEDEILDFKFLETTDKKLANLKLISEKINDFKESLKKASEMIKNEIIKEFIEIFKDNFKKNNYDICFRYFRLIKILDKLISKYTCCFDKTLGNDNNNLEIQIDKNDSNETEIVSLLRAEIYSLLEENVEIICGIFKKEYNILDSNNIQKIKKSIENINKINNSKLRDILEKNIVNNANQKIADAAKEYLEGIKALINTIIDPKNEKLQIDVLLMHKKSLTEISEIEIILPYIWKTLSNIDEILRTILSRIEKESLVFINRLIDDEEINDPENKIYKKNLENLIKNLKIVEESELISLLDKNFKESFYSKIRDAFENIKIITLNKANYGGNIALNPSFLMNTVKGYCRLSIINNSILIHIIFNEQYLEKELKTLEDRLDVFLQSQIKLIKECTTKEQLYSNLKAFKHNFIKRSMYLDIFKSIANDKINKLYLEFNELYIKSIDIYKDLIFSSIKNMKILFENKNFTSENNKEECEVIKQGYECLKDLEDLKNNSIHEFLYQILISDEENFHIDSYTSCFQDLKQYFTSSLQVNTINMDFNTLRNINQSILQELTRFDEFKNSSLPTFYKIFEDYSVAIKTGIPQLELEDLKKLENGEYKNLAVSLEIISNNQTDEINIRRLRVIKRELNLIVNRSSDRILNEFKVMNTDYYNDENIQSIAKNCEILIQIKDNFQTYIDKDINKFISDIIQKFENLFKDMKEQIIAYIKASLFNLAEKNIKILVKHIKILEILNLKFDFDEIILMKKDKITDLKKFYSNLKFENYRISPPKYIFEQLRKEEIIKDIIIANFYADASSEIQNIIEIKYAEKIQEILVSEESCIEKQQNLGELGISIDFIPEDMKNFQYDKLKRAQIEAKKNEENLIVRIDLLIKKNAFKELNKFSFKENCPVEINEKIKNFLNDKSLKFNTEINSIFTDFEYNNLENKISRAIDFHKSFSNFTECLEIYKKSFKKYLIDNIKKFAQKEREFFCLENLEWNFLPEASSNINLTLNSNNNDTVYALFLKEFIKLFDKGEEDYFEGFTNCLEEEINNSLELIKKWIYKINIMYQELKKDNVPNIERYYGIYEKVKEKNPHIKILNCDQIRNIIKNNEKIKNDEFLSEILIFKNPDSIIKEIEQIISTYEKEITTLINNDNNKLSESDIDKYVRAFESKIKSINFFYKYFLKNKGKIDQVNKVVENTIDSLLNELKYYDINLDINFNEENLSMLNIKISIMKKISIIILPDNLRISNSCEENIKKFCEILKVEIEKALSEKFCNYVIVKKNLIKLKKLSVFLKDYNKKFEEVIKELIDEITNKENAYNILNELKSLLSSDPIYGNSIMINHKAFEGLKNCIINKINKKFDIDYILKNLNCYVANISDNIYKIQKAELASVEDFKKSYTKYFEEFEKLFNEYISISGDVSSKAIKDKLNSAIKKIKDNLKLLIAKDYEEEKVSHKINPNLFNSIPVVLAHITAVYSILKIKNNYCIYNINIEVMSSFVHSSKIIAIFRLFCLDLKKTEFLMNNLVQISTGEGKNLILSLSAIIFALFGYDVNVAYITSNLSNKNEIEFKELFDYFEVSNYISYGNLTTILQRTIDKKVNIKNYFNQLIFNKNENDLKFLKSRKYQILLFDEVDMFFSEEYYGKTYNPSINFKDQKISNIFKLIWNNRNMNIQTLFKFIKESREFSACINIFTNCSNLLEEILKEILSDLDSFESHNYLVKDNKIVYLENEKFCFNVKKGYKTTFAYFKEKELGKISEDSLNNNIGITIKCSQFIFYNIPKEFNYIFGVSSTFKSLSNYQKKNLFQEYKISRFTIVPSIYVDNSLNPPRKTNYFIEKNKNDFYSRIKEVIENGYSEINSAKVNKPTIVIFKDLEKIKEFQNFFNNLQNEFSVLDKYKREFNIFHEKLKEEDIENLFKVVLNCGVQTLAEASIARNFDFIFRPNIINIEEGLNIVQTYVSENNEEENLIAGMSDLYGVHGSYSLIIQSDELNKYGINDQTFQEIKNSNVNKYTNEYEMMIEKRNEYNETIFKNKIESLEQAIYIHQESKNLIDFIKEKNQKEIESLILKFNQAKNLKGSIVRTKIYLDATMINLIEKFKSILIDIFNNISESLKKLNIEESTFSIEIVLFSNYTCSKEKIMISSGWQTNSDCLIKFLKENESIKKTGYKAIELCLFDASKEIEKLTNIFICSDSAGFSKSQVIATRENYDESFHLRGLNPKDYWNKSEFSKVVDYMEELEKLKKKKIPIFAFYIDDVKKEEKLKNEAEMYFKTLKQETDGEYEILNFERDNEYERLTKLISKPILRAIAQNISDEKKSLSLLNEIEDFWIVDETHN